MNIRLQASLVLCAALCFVGTAARADVGIKTHDNGRIDIEGTDIVITADDKSQAEIDPAGDLKIRGKDVPVTDAQRELLMQYSKNLLDMEKRGEAAERQVWRMAPGILGIALGDLFTGASDKQFDHDTGEAAKPLKDEFLKLCDDVEAERKVQDQISEALPAFKPYAVISARDTSHKCHSNSGT